MTITTIILVITLLVSVFALIKGADLFSDFAETIALYFKIPPFIIGMTIIAFGTSLPELFSASTAVLSGVSELAVGDIIGSNITNIFLVLGVATVIMKKKILTVSYDLIHVDLPFLVGSAFMAIMVLMDSKVTIFESIILLLGLILYLIYSITIRKDIVGKKMLEVLREEHPKKKMRFKNIVFGIIGLTGLLFGSKYFVKSIIELTAHLEVSLELVAVTLVPLSSNLPELSVTIRNSIKGKSEMVVGNILGSNIINIFGVLGISGLLGAVSVSMNFVIFVLPVLALATILYFFITQEKQITRWEGGLLLLSYFIYLNLMFTQYI